MQECSSGRCVKCICVMLGLVSVLTAGVNRGVDGPAVGRGTGIVDRSARGRFLGAGAKKPFSVDCTACCGFREEAIHLVLIVEVVDAGVTSVICLAGAIKRFSSGPSSSSSGVPRTTRPLARCGDGEDGRSSFASRRDGLSAGGVTKHADEGGEDESGAGDDDSNRSEDEDEGAIRALPYVRRTVGLVDQLGATSLYTQSILPRGHAKRSRYLRYAQITGADVQRSLGAT